MPAQPKSRRTSPAAAAAGTRPCKPNVNAIRNASADVLYGEPPTTVSIVLPRYGIQGVPQVGVGRAGRAGHRWVRRWADHTTASRAYRRWVQCWAWRAGPPGRAAGECCRWVIALRMQVVPQVCVLGWWHWARQGWARMAQVCWACAAGRVRAGHSASATGTTGLGIQGGRALVGAAISGHPEVLQLWAGLGWAAEAG